MIGGEWKDVSSYSQSDKVREPHSYELRVCGARIAVHRHMDYPGMWVTGSDWTVTLPNQPASPNLDDAKRIAVARVRRLCESMLVATAPSVTP